MAYSNRRNTGGYRVSGRDMLSYGYKYGENWAEDRRALERAFHETDRGHGKSGSAWSASTPTHGRGGLSPTGNYRGDEGQHKGGMEVMRVGGHGHFPRDSGSHGQQYPHLMPTTAAHAPSLSRSETYDYHNAARTFVGGSSGWENYHGPHMGNGSRGLAAQMPPMSVYPPSSCISWRSESPYGDDRHDRNASRLGLHLEEDMMYGSGSANMYSPGPNRYWRSASGEYGSHGHGYAPASAYGRDDSTPFSDYDSEYPESGSDSRYSNTGYIGSPYSDFDYREEVKTYLSDSESYDSQFIDEGTYDDKSSEGQYSGSEAGSDSEFYVSDDDGYSD